MLIPAFVSMPNALSQSQFDAQRIVLEELGHHGIEARTLGRTDYPTSFPLREVLTLAKHCSGGLILGFSQFESRGGIWKNGTPFVNRISGDQAVCFPTPWNQLEAGILFALEVPMLVFREPQISGGVFDKGVTDLFVHSMPSTDLEEGEKVALRSVIQRWSSQVRSHYYGELRT